MSSFKKRVFVDKGDGPKAESLGNATFRDLENEELARKPRKVRWKRT